MLKRSEIFENFTKNTGSRSKKLVKGFLMAFVKCLETYSILRRKILKENIFLQLERRKQNKTNRIFLCKILESQKLTKRLVKAHKILIRPKIIFLSELFMKFLRIRFLNAFRTSWSFFKSLDSHVRFPSCKTKVL